MSEENTLTQSLETIRVLLVEDSEIEAPLIQESLEESPLVKIELTHTENLRNTLLRIEEGAFDVILLDLGLPDSWGLDTFAKVNYRSPDIPIVVLSSFEGEDLAIQAVRHGAQDYLVKGEADGSLLVRSLRYAIERKRTETEIRRAHSELEQRVRERSIQLAEANEALEAEIVARKNAHELLKKSLFGIINAMAQLVEIRDPYTAGHQQRVAHLACAMAEEMGFSGDQINNIHIAGLIHDIGKVYVPTEILSKPGMINEIEFSMIKYHIHAGYEIVKEIGLPQEVVDIVCQHHERIDGSGYPRGMMGSELRPESKILAVADVVEAMLSHRPYRPSHGLDAALDEISLTKGKLYDADAVDACIKLFTEKNFSFE